ncbi:glycosyltransferase [Methylomonas sp. OY6]|uniref:Glycosyltransferase n=1 Tax=Methylomonas defluvii TaxID=3045149 RepID=A0ABU4UJA5_9GAMM|nr:glycosyltransferase [Methylomonas sp. OY6]MDX8129465.1 glycosyltransferase [Methylomonas sp. OY6]
MNILIVSMWLPMPDRASADLRFYTFLKILSKSHQITICPFNLNEQVEEIGEEAVQGYLNILKNLSIHLGTTDVLTTLRIEKFDIVIFEYFHYVNRYIDFVRFFQPKARILVDSVDITYNRFFSKANLTKDSADFKYAETIKNQELSAYARADMTITVTIDDDLLLKKDISNIKTCILPNIHKIPERLLRTPPYTKLLFVGAFKHEPNIDAIHYFCKEIFPKILEVNPNFQLEVVGPNPPESVLELQSENIFIRGFIEDLEEHYRNAHISIAPLRFGGGMKGKIGEALSYGIPVVTTQIGAEGFGLTNNENILVAETSNQFAELVLKVSRDEQFYEKLSINGYNFIKDKYSEDATNKRITEIIDSIPLITPKKLSVITRIKMFVKFSYNRHFGWRLNSTK